MKAGIVLSSTLQKHGTWSANYYLGDQSTTVAALRRAEARLKEERARVKRLKKEIADGEKFQGDMVKNGEVKPLE